MKRHNDLRDLSAFDFPVKMVDIFHQIDRTNWNVIADYKAVRREDTDAILAIHSDKYHLTKHVDVFNSTIDVLEPVLQMQSRGGVPSVDIRDHVFNDGAYVMRDIICRGIELLGPDGRTVFFRIRQVNSYDASSRYIMSAGLWREWCSNGAGIMTAKVSATSQKHTSKINIAAEQNKLKSAIRAFFDEWPVWKQWHITNVSTEDVIRMFALTLVAEKGVDTEGKEKYNKKQLSILTDAWERNSLELGRTKWAAYQAATWWASHGESEKRSAEQISLEREPKVLAMVNSSYWRNL